jgi:hypothetical protein
MLIRTIYQQIGQFRPALIAFAMIILCSSSCTSKRQEPYVSYLSIAQLMDWVIDPAADAIWDSVAWYSTLKGERAVSPKSDAQWESLRNSAATLMEASNLLMFDQRAKDKEEWVKYAKRLGMAAQNTLTAVQAKDVQAVFDNGTKIDEACEACHLKYAYPVKQN